MGLGPEFWPLAALFVVGLAVVALLLFAVCWLLEDLTE
jgi:hypothetical protein